MTIYRLKQHYTTLGGSEHSMQAWIEIDPDGTPARSVAEITAFEAVPSTPDQYAYNWADALTGFLEAGASIGPCTVQEAVIVGKAVSFIDQEDANFSPKVGAASTNGAADDMPGAYCAFTGKGSLGGAWRQFIFGVGDLFAGKPKLVAIPATYSPTDPNHIYLNYKNVLMGVTGCRLITKPHANSGSTGLEYFPVNIKGRVRFGINRNNYRHNRV